jgi:hypothetical protein
VATIQLYAEIAFSPQCAISLCDLIEQFLNKIGCVDSWFDRFLDEIRVAFLAIPQMPNRPWPVF